MNTITTLNTALTGRYEVEREIGAGGMANVFLARDLRHNRKVAVKLLKPELGAILGVERFLAEIQVTANLQHPNLLPLFDSGEADGLLFYVMPFVEGESLRARLEREKQLPVDEAVRIASAIANALAYAHQHDVIHRDLKPENILLQAGQPMIADFGIALAVSNAGGARITQTGLSLGTPQYMSPEQATGDRAIDGRTDVYSLGAMLYEMLVGDPPHLASTSQAVIAKVLTDRPRGVRTQRPSVPEHIDAAIQRALEKLPADRWGSAQEFADALAGRVVTSTVASEGRSAPHSRLSDPIFLAVAGVATLAMATAAFLWARHQETAPDVVRFALSPDTAATPVFAGTWSVVPSPDGKLVVYTATSRGGTQLYARTLNQLQGRPIAGTERATQPIFSPDGKWIAFLADGKLKKVLTEGGTPVVLADAGANNGADWSVNHEIILGAESGINGLSRMSDAGGKQIPITTVDSAKGDNAHLWPVVLADGNTVIFAIWDGKTKSGSRLAITTIKEGRVSNLGVTGMAPLGVLDGELVYVQADGAVMAVPIDVGKRQVGNNPVPVLDPVTVCPSCNGDAAVRISRNGAIAYMRGSVASRLFWVDHHGTHQLARDEAAAYATPRISPDGTRIAVQIAAGVPDIWIYTIATKTMSRLTSNGPNVAPEWSPDGKSVLFNSSRGGKSAIWRQPADGSGVPELLADGAALGGTLTPDGKTLLYTTFVTTLDIMQKTVGDNSPPRPFVVTGAFEFDPQVSPDGRWVAYGSSESGTDEIYVRAVDGSGGRIQVSSGGGANATWSGDSRRIFYHDNRWMRSAAVTSTPTFTVTSRDSLFALQRGGFFGGSSYDVTRDGSRFLVLETGEDQTQVVAVVNWVAELRARVGKR